jgi:hypothetical protein
VIVGGLDGGEGVGAGVVGAGVVGAGVVVELGVTAATESALPPPQPVSQSATAAPAIQQSARPERVCICSIEIIDVSSPPTAVLRRATPRCGHWVIWTRLRSTAALPDAPPLATPLSTRSPRGPEALRPRLAAGLPSDQA